MQSTFSDKFRHALNTDVATRLLVRYFLATKGFQSLDQFIYPALIMDMPVAIPELSDKIEIIPYAKNIDLVMDRAILGWNLFILGNRRMYLGDTYHNELRRLVTDLRSGTIVPTDDKRAVRMSTPRTLIAFVTRVLETHEQGYIDLAKRTIPPQQFGNQMGNTGNGKAFFSQSRPR